MPDIRLAHRAGLINMTPTGAALSSEERAALQERILAVETVAELPDADQALLRQVVFDVSAGKSFLSDPSEQGDWEALDAAEDSDDPEAMERALDTVGRGQEVLALGGDARLLPPLGSGDIVDDTSNDDPGDLDDEPYDVPDTDDTAWVGL